MRLRIFALIIVLSILSGCKTASVARNPNDTPRLKSLLKRTDVVLVKHFYTATNIDGDRDPKFDNLLPARVQIEPLWIYEPNKEKEGLKGAMVTVIPSRVLGESNGESNEEAILDIDELRDFAAALEAMRNINADWRSGAATDHVEEEFSAKDDFSASAFHDSSDGLNVLVISVRSASAVLNFPKAEDAERAVHDAIELLDSKN